MNRELLHQIRRLRLEVGQQHALLAAWGRAQFPDGRSDAPRALSQAEWQGLYLLLENAALQPGVVTSLPRLEDATRDARPDGPLPVAIANFDVAVPRAELVEDIRAALQNGSDLRALPAAADAVVTASAFMATGWLHEQWMRGVPLHRGRDVTLVLQHDLYLTNPGKPWPDEIMANVGDGRGWQPVRFGVPFGPARAEGDAAVAVAIRCRYGDDVRTARFEVAVSDVPAPPVPDDTWKLRPAPAGEGEHATGSAWVFHAPGHTDVVNPVILVEGFPGRHPCDFMYELLDHGGLVRSLHAAGYDLVIVGLDDGMIPIERNASVLAECIRQARKRTSRALVVGGVSMGGLVSRYTLALMEKQGQPHGTRAYLSIDAPHGGTYTSLGVQWFVHLLLPFAPALSGFAGLLDSPSNQQLLIQWLHDGNGKEPSKLRGAFLDLLEEVGGYPMQPLKLTVSCGSDRGTEAHGHEPVLTWSDAPWIDLTLHASDGDADGIVAKGSSFLAEPPELAPLAKLDGPAWEDLPGSQNEYYERAAQIAQILGCRGVKLHRQQTCSVPTFSAFGLAPEGAIAEPDGPFDRYKRTERNALHLELTDEVSDWIVRALGRPPRPITAGGKAWNPYAFDPYEPGFLQDPYPTYARFREHCADFYVSQFASRWFFHRAACEEILGRTETFVKESPKQRPAASGPYGILRRFPPGIFDADPPRHECLRGAIEPPFRELIGAAPDDACRRASEILGEIGAKGHMELLADYAIPVPSGVLFGILGLSDEHHLGLRTWVDLMVQSHDVRQNPRVRFQGGTARMALQVYLDGVLREPEPRGLIGALRGQVGNGLHAEDVYISCIDFVVAGYLSTTWLVASALYHMLPRQEIWRALHGDRPKLDAAIAEVLRLESPIQLIDRYVKHETSLCGVDLEPGDKVTAVLGSANRDGISDPDELDIERDGPWHLSFGSGIHRCIGAPLAEQVAPAMLEPLLELKHLAIDGHSSWQTDPYLRGLTSLPLKFAPVPRGASVRRAGPAA